MTTTFWLISAPGNNGNMWTILEENTSSMSKNAKLNIPKLRAGTLDSLMTLSDDLVKQDQQVEVALRKLERQMMEFGEMDLAIHTENRKTVSLDEYIFDFKWASSKYQEKLTLPELVSKIFLEAMKADDDLRAKQADYNQLKTSMAAIERKQKGSLSVRSLTSLGLRTDRFVDTENFVTVGVVVPKSDDKTWLQSYELGFLGKESNLGFSPVLMGSSTKIFEDDSDDLWTVTLFRRKLQDFKNAVREKQPRWTVREFTMDEKQLSDEKAQMEQVQQQESKTRKNLATWCKAMHGEVFRAFVHLKVIRLFVESALRYGVPPDFQAVVMKPNLKNEKSLRDALSRQFQSLGSASLYKNVDENMPAGMGGTDFFPYVFFPLTISNSTAQ